MEIRGRMILWDNKRGEIHDRNYFGYLASHISGIRLYRLSFWPLPVLWDWDGWYGAIKR